MQKSVSEQRPVTEKFCQSYIKYAVFGIKTNIIITNFSSQKPNYTREKFCLTGGAVKSQTSDWGMCSPLFPLPPQNLAITITASNSAITIDRNAYINEVMNVVGEVFLHS